MKNWQKFVLVCWTLLVFGGVATYVSGSGGGLSGAITEALIVLSDITTNNSTTGRHGFLNKLDGDNSHCISGLGNWVSCGGAPSNASYVTVTSEAGLSNETAIDSLCSGGGTISFPAGTLVCTNYVGTVIANASSTGTTQYKLAKLTGAPSTAVITATTDTANIIGPVQEGAGTTGSAVIATNGIATCAFDSATTAGNWVIEDTSTAGDCQDTGSTTRPTTSQPIGRVLSTNGGAGNYLVALDLGPAVSGGGGVTETSFSVNKNGTAQTISHATVTTLTWGTEVWDTGGYFASNTFTPLVAGHYHFTAVTEYDTPAATNTLFLWIYKNGAVACQAGFYNTTTNGANVQSVNCDLNANGTTDAFDVRVEVFTAGGSLDVSGDGTKTYFSGYLIH